MNWHPDEGIEDDSSMTEQGLGLILTGIIDLTTSPLRFLWQLLKHEK